jgi:hypothetical protein
MPFLITVCLFRCEVSLNKVKKHMDFVRVWLCLRCTPRVYAAPLQIYQFIYRTVPIARSFACLCMHACAQARVRVRVRVHALKMDKLRTNHKGTYELQDHRFRSVLRISTVLRRCVYCWIYVESYSSYASYPLVRKRRQRPALASSSPQHIFDTVPSVALRYMVPDQTA